MSLSEIKVYFTFVRFVYLRACQENFQYSARMHIEIKIWNDKVIME